MDTVPGPDALFRLDGKVAVVTGAAQGIGRALALGLAGFGADIVIVDTQPGPAAAVAAEVERLGRGALVVEADVTAPGSADDCVRRALDRWGRLDILVNNAGVWSLRPALELTLAEWDTVLAVNLTAPFVWSQRAAAAMLAGNDGGSIVNIASISGALGFPGRAAYAASKHGLIGLTRSLANDWAARGVRVNAIGPGGHDTELTRAYRDDPANLKLVLDRIPMRRIGRPDELVGAAVFLASAASSYLTGQTIFVDGGWLLE